MLIKPPDVFLAANQRLLQRLRIAYCTYKATAGGMLGPKAGEDMRIIIII